MISAAVRSGDLTRLRRGVYARPSEERDRFEARLEHDLALICAVGEQLGGSHVISHASAALLWGLPSTRHDAVHVTQLRGPHHSSPDVRRHRAWMPAEDVVELGGRAVTSLARTVVDCATTLGAPDGLVVADAGLRAGLDREDLLARLNAMAGRRGVRRARAVIAAADPGAESAGESLLRHLVLRAGLPVPQTQVPVETPEGTFWADIGWEELRLLGEYDGAAKYTARSTAADAVARERRREVLIERERWGVARATSADLRRPRQYLAALAAAAPSGRLPPLEPRRWLA